MARSFARSLIHTRARFHADKEGSGVGVSDVRVNDLINAHLCTVWLALVKAGPPDYYSTDYPITTVSGTLAYALPADFLKCTRVMRVIDVNRSYPTTEIDGDVRPYYQPPQGARSVTLEYVPAPPTIDTSSGGDATTFDGIAGYEELVCKLVARDICKKTQSTDMVQLLTGECQELLAQIKANAKRSSGSRHIIDRDTEDGNDMWSLGTNAIRAYRIRAGNVELYERRIAP